MGFRNKTAVYTNYIYTRQIQNRSDQKRKFYHWSVKLELFTSIRYFSNSRIQISLMYFINMYMGGIEIYFYIKNGVYEFTRYNGDKCFGLFENIL